MYSVYIKHVDEVLKATLRLCCMKLLLSTLFSVILSEARVIEVLILHKILSGIMRTVFEHLLTCQPVSSLFFFFRSHTVRTSRWGNAKCSHILAWGNLKQQISHLIFETVSLKKTCEKAGHHQGQLIYYDACVLCNCNMNCVSERKWPHSWQMEGDGKWHMVTFFLFKDWAFVLFWFTVKCNML